MVDWKTFRAEFPLLDRCIYLNACSLGPLPRRGMAALHRYAADWDAQGTPVWFTTWLPLLTRFRAKAGELLNAPAGSTAIAPSVSVALTTLASGLPLPPGRDKVLIGELDFYTTGYLQDVRAIADAAHAAGALCLIDGYQTCGCVPLDVEAMGCDAFAGGCLKWVSGGPGNAFLYVRPSLIPDVRPQGTGWFATRDPFSFTLQELVWADDARRLETGTWAVGCHYAGLAGLSRHWCVVEEELEGAMDVVLDPARAPPMRAGWRHPAPDRFG